MIAYLVTNKISGRQYVGITARSGEERWQDHCRKTRKGSVTPFHCAIRKYGPAAFSVEIIASAASWSDLLETEVRLIEQFGTLIPGGYNATRGGRGNCGHAHSQETKAKLSATVVASMTPERRAEMSKERRGRKMPAGFGPMISALNKGKVRSPEQRARISAGRKGMKFSEEHRRNIGLAQRGKSRLPTPIATPPQS